jgi:hypothetical protein
MEQKERRAKGGRRRLREVKEAIQTTTVWADQAFSCHVVVCQSEGFVQTNNRRVRVPRPMKVSREGTQTRAFLNLPHGWGDGPGCTMEGKKILFSVKTGNVRCESEFCVRVCVYVCERERNACE